MTLHVKMILLSLALLTVGFEVAYGGKLPKNLDKTKGQGGLERINENWLGFNNSTKWVMRKLRKMIKAFEILEEQFVTVNETMVAGMADMADMNNTLASQLVSASADIASNTADIASLVTDTATNNASIASNDVRLATLTGNVTSNTVDIASNTAGVASNSANIVSNDGDIVTLTSAVGTNAADIASASANIDSLVRDTATNNASIASLVQDTSNNTAYLASHSSAIGALKIDVNTNEAGIATNLANIASNDVDIVSLKTNGSGSVWFDAVRISNFDASSWTRITYSYANESNAGAMDVGNGEFTAPLAGTYQFMVQVRKDYNTYCWVRLMVDGTTVSYLFDGDTSNYATITGAAIVEMQPGQKVWAESAQKLFSNDVGYIHFTGVLITPK